jgi:hypothetical protein
MHLLEPFAFVPEIEDPVIVDFGAAVRMTLLQAGEASEELIAHFHHEAPEGGDAIQIGFLPHTRFSGDERGTSRLQRGVGRLRGLRAPKAG